MRRIFKPFLVVLALIFLFEAWLWEHLRPLVAATVNVIAWDRLKARLAALIDWLPPWAVLIVFVIPFIVLLPLKFAEVYFLVHKQWIAAIFVLVVAKLLGLGVTAFIFDVTRPMLLQMGWSRLLYDFILFWLARARTLVDPIKQQSKRAVRRYLWLFGHGQRGRFLERLARIRRRMQTQHPAK